MLAPFLQKYAVKSPTLLRAVSWALYARNSMRITVYYLLTLLTGGQFAFIWLFIMAKQAGLNIPKYKIILFFSVYSIYLLLVFSSIYQFINGQHPTLIESPITFKLMPLMVVLIFWFAGSVFYKVISYIRSQSIELPNNIILTVLILVYGATFPLLQSKLNNVPYQSV